MASLEEHRNKLTVFYSLNTGKVKCYCGGIQDMNYFGDDKEDYNYDYIVVDYDNFILKNFDYSWLLFKKHYISFLQHNILNS